MLKQDLALATKQLQMVLLQTASSSYLEAEIVIVKVSVIDDLTVQSLGVLQSKRSHRT